MNRLYVVQIYVCSAIDEKILDDDIFFGKVEQNFKGVFVKNAIVYNKNNSYIDLMSGETYKLGLDNVFEIGQLYIRLTNGLKPLNQFFDVDFKKENMSRKRIIRTLSKSKLLNEKEDDK